MAKKRLIPKLQLLPSTIDSASMSLVTTVGFDKVIEIGDPVSQAKIYESQLADELIFVDLSHSKKYEDLDILVQIVESVSKSVFLPLTVGGGVKKIEDFKSLLDNGADKVSINSSALETPEFIDSASKKFGAQCVVVSIDYRVNADGSSVVFGKSGRARYDKTAESWVQEVVARGAGEILLTCIERDGTRGGLELEVAKRICDNSPVPVIVSGGCGRAQHFIDGYNIAGADAVSAGTYFCFQDQNPMQTRGHIKNAGVDIRVST